MRDEDPVSEEHAVPDAQRMAGQLAQALTLRPEESGYRAYPRLRAVLGAGV